MKKLVDGGVRIALGTDSGGDPQRYFIQGFAEHHQMELMVEAGLTPMQVIQAFSQWAAETLRIDKDFGTVAKGKAADVLVLDRNPLQDIRNMRSIAAVYEGGVIMSNARRLRLVVALAIVTWLGAGEGPFAQGLLNPYRAVDGWAQLPAGRRMGAVGDVTVDPDGKHIWAVVRCDASDPARFGDECRDSDLDSILKFSPEGKVVASFGGGMFIWPHGIDVDPDGNVWVTDAVSPARTPAGKRGHQVVKFSPTGKVLMTLGTPGVPGGGSNHFNAPSDVVVADNGDIFVADGHGLDGNSRVAKFSKDGKFIKAWGRTGYAPGEFRTLHAIAIDSRGRLFVADRSNNRIQIFDLEGKFLAMWTQFGRPSGIFFDDKDQIYVADSESDNEQNPGWEMGIRIGDARTGWVTAFILYPWGDPRDTAGNGAEFVAVDRAGNLYGGEPRPRKLQKYVRVRP